MVIGLRGGLLRLVTPPTIFGELSHEPEKRPSHDEASMTSPTCPKHAIDDTGCLFSTAAREYEGFFLVSAER